MVTAVRTRVRRSSGITFRERSPVTMGVIGIVGIVLLLFGLFNVHTVLSNLRTYDLQAVFAEAGGLKPGDDVRLVGKPVGTVTAVGLDRNTVLVKMQVDRGISLRGATRAQVRTATALGVKYVALIPQGDGELEAGSRIPLSRTQSAYDVTQALAQLTLTADAVDTKQLARTLDEVSSTFQRTPDEFARALGGVEGLSDAINQRDTQLKQVFHQAAVVSQVLTERQTQIQRLVTDGGQLAAELTSQRVALDQMIANLNELASQLRTFVKDGQTRIRPALQELNGLVELLMKNKKNLQAMLTGLPFATRGLSESVGNGPFFTAYLGNLTPKGFPVFPN